MKRFASEVSAAEQGRIIATFAEVFPLVLPAGWHFLDMSGDGVQHMNARWLQSTDGLRVCAEVEFNEADLWLHISFSRRYRDPNYFDMKRIKDTFVGKDRKALMVLPSEAEHYNFMPHCLHFYTPLDRDPLPDFRHASGAL